MSHRSEIITAGKVAIQETEFGGFLIQQKNPIREDQTETVYLSAEEILKMAAFVTANQDQSQ